MAFNEWAFLSFLYLFIFLLIFNSRFGHQLILLFFGSIICTQIYQQIKSYIINNRLINQLF
jgi:hypothetical protein